MVAGAVHIDGFDEFRRAIRDVDRELPKQMRAGMRRWVADPVAARIRADVPRGPGRPPGHWYQEIRGGATQRAAYVQWGRRLVYPPIVEFAKKWGGVPGRGRYVYPEIERSQELAARAAERVLDDVFRRARLTLG